MAFWPQKHKQSVFSKHEVGLYLFGFGWSEIGPDSPFRVKGYRSLTSLVVQKHNFI